MTMKRSMTIFGSAIGASILVAAAVAGVEGSVSPLWADDATRGADTQIEEKTSEGEFQPPLLGAPQKRVGAGSRVLSASQSDPCEPSAVTSSSDEVAKATEAAEVPEVAEVECESETTPTK